MTWFIVSGNQANNDRIPYELASTGEGMVSCSSRRNTMPWECTRYMAAAWGNSNWATG